MLICFSFSAALLGLPKLLNESDIHAEYPADVDDENVSERGFQSTLPGETTKISSALALVRLARIISKVLDEIYPAASSHDLSLHKIEVLGDELDEWLGSLPAHLRLHFLQDKPSTSVVGSRSPLLVRFDAMPSISLLNSVLVSWVPLLSHAYPSSCRWLYSWKQSFIFCCRSCTIKQAHHPDRSAT